MNRIISLREKLGVANGEDILSVFGSKKQADRELSSFVKDTNIVSVQCYPVEYPKDGQITSGTFVFHPNNFSYQLRNFTDGKFEGSIKNQNDSFFTSFSEIYDLFSIPQDLTREREPTDQLKGYMFYSNESVIKTTIGIGGFNPVTAFLDLIKNDEDGKLEQCLSDVF